MAKQRFKGALNAVSFPMVSILQTRTVVQPQYDVNTKTPRNRESSEDYSDYSIPQLLYCENVLPTGEGLQSVGYIPTLTGLAGITKFDQAITLRDAVENNFLLSPAGGLNYIYTANTAAWVSTNPIANGADKTVTRAFVNGRTFVAYSGIGVFEYDTVAGTFLQVAVLLPPGFTIDQLSGIGSSNNYLLLFINITVLWSSLINPLDFIPSLQTGAGNAVPQDVKGQIKAVVGIAGGYIIYTTKNAVSAVYTNNVKSPFTFKEVSGAGGVISYEQVTAEQSPGPHYAWTTGGLQKITIQGAEPVSAEVSDFLAGRMWEYFDAATVTLTQVTNTNPEFPVKLTYISSRWLVLSYNTTDAVGMFNYALVYDLTLKRWGKLKVDHVDCFYYPYPNLIGDLSYDNLAGVPYDMLSATSYPALAFGISSAPTSKLSVGFLSANGAVSLLSMDYNKTLQQNGVAIFGKFQFIRANLMTVQQLSLEGVYRGTPATTVDVWVGTSFDGYRPDSVKKMTLLKANDKLANYAKRVTGINHNITVAGTFALSAYLLEVTQDGDR